MVFYLSSLSLLEAFLSLLTCCTILCYICKFRKISTVYFIYLTTVLLDRNLTRDFTKKKITKLLDHDTVKNIRGFKYFLAGIYDFLTLPILKKYIDYYCIHVTTMFYNIIYISRICYNLKKIE